MIKINARTSGSLSVTFRDKMGVPSAPTTVTYRVDCLTNRRNIRPITTLNSPAAEMTIPITSDDTAIANRSNPVEHRRVTIVASYTDASDQVTSQQDFEVTNLPYL